MTAVVVGRWHRSLELETTFGWEQGLARKSMKASARSSGIFGVLLVLMGFIVSQPSPAAKAAPPVALANLYRSGIALDDYWVSEKYDGVRGYWDGENLLTRSGAIIRAPAWFTAHWPRTPMDGELWAGRGEFELASATIHRQTPDDAAWHRIHYMVFDLPAHPGPFTERITVLRRLVAQLDLAWVLPVRQYKVASEAALKQQLEQVIQQGGEGLVLHKGASFYREGRSDDLLKYKPYDDAEARVIAQLPGKGKFTGMLGSLVVETPGGVRFRLGSGFNDEQRRHPPPIGSLVTYRYRGMTSGGKPRFATFMRVRDEL